MRPGRLLTGSTTNESSPVVIPFRCLFCATVDGCCPPETFLNGMSRRNKSAHSHVPLNLGSCGLVPFLGKPAILRWLGHSHDGSVTPSTADLVRSATHHSS